MAILMKDEYPLFFTEEGDSCEGEPWTACPDYIVEDAMHEEMEFLMNRSLNLPDNEVVGGLLQFERNGDWAWYLVRREKPLLLQWVPRTEQTIEPDLIRALHARDVKKLLQGQKELAARYGESLTNVSW